MGFDGCSTVSDELGQEKIVGTPDMTPALSGSHALEGTAGFVYAEMGRFPAVLVPDPGTRVQLSRLVAE